MKKFITFLMILGCIFMTIALVIIENKFKIELGMGLIFCIIFAYVIPLAILKYFIDKYIDNEED